ncbi:MAG: glycosyltransferase family 2 protein [Desulfobacterales bacterium]|nr:glycosyltransferase family 2 protein [Desulfobacterales bacterium]
MKLSILIPVFNEETTLQALLDLVLESPFQKEVLIVDDSSTDGTPEILERFRGREGVRLFRHRRNRGKGASVRTAIAHVTGDVAIIQDADLEYDPQDYEKLIAPIVDGEEEVVFGTRVPLGNPHSYVRYYLGGRFLSLLANLLYNQHITDEPCGYKAFDAQFLKSLPLERNGFDIDPELTAKVAKRGIRICEVPIRYIPRSFSEGKKIRWIDGLMAVWVLFKYRFSPAKRRRG